MSRNTDGDGLNEIDRRAIAEAEADLARLLSIEPSVELAAKVRERIAREPGRSRGWLTGWRLAFAAASLVVVGLAIALALKSRTAVPPPTPAIATTQPPGVPQVQPEPREPYRDERVPNREERDASREMRNASRDVRDARSEERAASNEPEVLVPPDQRLAIARVLSMSIETREFPAQTFPKPPAEGEPPVAPIVVDQVVVPPILGGAGIENNSDKKEQE